MNLGSLILEAGLRRQVLRKKDTPNLFVVVAGNANGGRSYAGFQPVKGRGLFGCFPYILQFCLPGMTYIHALQTEGWSLIEDSGEEYEFFYGLIKEHKWDCSAGIDHIEKSHSGVAVVTYAREGS